MSLYGIWPYWAGFTKQEEDLVSRFYEGEVDFTRNELEILLSICEETEESVQAALSKEHDLSFNAYEVTCPERHSIELMLSRLK